MSHIRLLQDRVRTHLVDADDPAPFTLASESLVDELEEVSTGVESLQAVLVGLTEIQSTIQTDNVSVESFDSAVTTLLKSHDLSLTDLGISVSQEALGTRIRKIIAAVLTALDKFIEFIRNVFETIFNDVIQINAYLYDTRLRLSSKRGALQHASTIALGRQTPFLSTDRGAPKTVRHISNGLVELRQQLALVRVHYATAVSGIGNELPGYLAKVDYTANGSNANLNLLDQLNTTFDKIKLRDIGSRVTRLSPFVDFRFPAGATFIGSPLIGMRSLVFILGDLLHPEDYASGDPRRKAYAIQSSKLVLTRSNPARKAPQGDYHVEALNYAGIDEFLKIVDNLVAEVAAAYRTDLRKRLRSSSKEMQRALSVLRSENAMKVTDLSPFVNYCTCYINWARSPYPQMLSLALISARETLLFARKHIRNL